MRLMAGREEDEFNCAAGTRVDLHAQLATPPGAGAGDHQRRARRWSPIGLRIVGRSGSPSRLRTLPTWGSLRDLVA